MKDIPGDFSWVFSYVCYDQVEWGGGGEGVVCFGDTNPLSLKILKSRWQDAYGNISLEVIP